MIFTLLCLTIHASSGDWIRVNITPNLEAIPFQQLSSWRWSSNLHNETGKGKVVIPGNDASGSNPTGILQGFSFEREADHMCNIPSIPHSFVAAALTAWGHHRSFRMSPDHFLHMIVQGVVTHVNEHSEELRSKYVAHSSKKKLFVKLDYCIPDELGCDWAKAVDHFIEDIELHTVPDTASMLQANFSTTGPVGQIVQKMNVMSAVKSYFQYVVETMCGFPSVEFEGVLGDWQLLKMKTIALLESDKVMPEFGSRWKNLLQPVLEKILDTVQGVEDASFWNAMVK